MYELPTPNGGLAELMAMADRFGVEPTFRFLRMMRTIGAGRNRTNTDNPAGQILPLLAAMMLRAYPGGDHVDLSKDLGYHWSQRVNFTRLLAQGEELIGGIDDQRITPIGRDRLPTLDEGIYGLLGFAAEYGLVEAFQFLRFVRNIKADVPPTQASAILAARLVREHHEADPDLTYKAARHEVAMRLGYDSTRSGATTPNFYTQLKQVEQLLPDLRSAPRRVARKKTT